jgi:hypothetical protein
MTLNKSEVLALRGLRLPPVALKALQRAGIYCQPMVSIEFQQGADRYLIRGVESGGAVPGCGAYCAFADEHGAPPEIIQPIANVGVNGVHAASLSPVLVRAQVFRSECHYELLLTRHSLVSITGKARPALHNSVLFHSKYGVLDVELWGHQSHLRGVIARQGTKIEEILEGYPALNREKVELAPLYVQAFPRRGRPANRPWAKKRPIR